MTPAQFTDTTIQQSILVAIEKGDFATSFAKFWLRQAGFTEAYGDDGPWLLDFGHRLEDALRGAPATLEDRVQDLARWLNGEACHGPDPDAAAFFLVHMVAHLQSRAMREQVIQGLLPESREAPAFAVLAAIGHSVSE